MRRAVALALLATCGLPAGAQATSPPPPNIAGLWNFEADLPVACRFNGQARLAPTSDPSRFSCELTAEQDCPSFGVRYVVEQSCDVEVEDGVASVYSTIQTFLMGEPTQTYLPDNFQLRVEDESTMTGVLIGTGAYPAEWRRAEGAIS